MKGKEKNFVSAVVYVHNDEEKIGGFLEKLLRVWGSNFEHSEIICVNDCSQDGSFEKIRKVSESALEVSVSVVHMSCYHGLEAAMNAGVDMAIGDFVFEFDRADFDFNDSVIMDVYRRSLEGFDIVSALPDQKERLSSRVFYYVFNRFAQLPCQMRTERFRILSRRVINRISSMNKTVPYRKAVYANCGLKTDYIIYTVTGIEEKHKKDRRERDYRFGLAVDSLLLFTQLGYRFSMIMTAVMMLFTIFMLIYCVMAYFIIHPVEGWTTTVLFFSIAFFGIFGVLTVVVKYLQILVDLVFRRKNYSFERIDKLTR